MSAKRWTNAEILDALLTGVEQGAHFTWAPRLSDNYISGLDLSKRSPKLILSLANGQHFEVSVKRIPG